MRGALVLTVGLLTGLAVPSCAVERKSTAQTTEASSRDAAAIALHRTLLERARAGDLQGFSDLLTPESRRLLTQFFDATRAADPSQQRAVGWSELVEEHAKLPMEAAERAPYPVVGTGTDARLDLAGHVDATFFSEVRDAARRAEHREPGSEEIP